MLSSLTESAFRAPKLSEVLFDQRRNTFETLAPLPSNVEAIKAGMMLATGLTTFAAFQGPSGWGKSHLLDAIAFRASADHRTVHNLSIQAYLFQASRYDSCDVLLLDDVQEVYGKTRARQDLRLHLERRVKAGRVTALAFTTGRTSRYVKGLLPAQRLWSMCSIESPAPEERIPLLDHMARAEGLRLSTQLTRILAFMMHGSGCTLSGALKRLRLSGSTWTSTADTLRACGLLDPFFTDNVEWDLNHKILKVASSNQLRFRIVDTRDLALYTMLCVAGLSEASVARAADVEPAEAYGRATSFGRLVGSDGDVAAVARQFVELVVCSLIQS